MNQKKKKRVLKIVLGKKIRTYRLKQLFNRVLLYSTGNHIQYSSINHNEKEYEKQYIYLYN